MTTSKLIISILIMAAITFGTRLAPFVIFGRGEKPPKIIIYLGKYLPPAIITIIIVYCFKNVTLTSGNHAIPEVLASITVILLQLKLKNTMISIFTGTALYMVLLHLIPSF